MELKGVVLSIKRENTDMILTTIEMTVLPPKRQEFMQTIHALIKSIRKEKGCMKCSAFQDIEDENTYRVVHGWETEQDLDLYLRSDLFEVLLGTKYFLSRPWEISFLTVSTTNGCRLKKGTLQSHF